MLSWVIQITILSIILVFLVHHLFNFFKSTLTVPKIKDLVNTPAQKYENMLNIINSNNTVKYDTSINGVIQLLKDMTISSDLNSSHIIFSSPPPPPDIGILMMNHAINRVEIKNELRRIKKRSLGLHKSNIQTKKRKIVNKVNKVNKVKTDLEVIGESIS